jgi:hypothetical protein
MKVNHGSYIQGDYELILSYTVKQSHKARHSNIQTLNSYCHMFEFMQCNIRCLGVVSV